MKSEEFLNEKSVARARKAAQAAQMAKKSAPTVKPPANLSTAPTVPTAQQQQQPQQPAGQPAVFKSNRTAQQPAGAVSQQQAGQQTHYGNAERGWTDPKTGRFWSEKELRDLKAKMDPYMQQAQAQAQAGQQGTSQQRTTQQPKQPGNKQRPAPATQQSFQQGYQTGQNAAATVKDLQQGFQQFQTAAQQGQASGTTPKPTQRAAAVQQPVSGSSAIDALSQEYDQQRMAKPTVPTTSEPGAFSKSVANGINVGSNMLKGITQAIQQHSPHTGSFYQPTQVVKTPAPISTQNTGTTIAPARGTTPAALNQAVAAAQGKVAKQSTGTPEIDNMLRAMGKLNEGKNASN